MAKINSIPLGARVIVRRDKASSHTPGGVIIPDSSQEPPGRGTVLAIGGGEPTASGNWFDVPLEVGDQVLFSPLAGVDMMIEGQNVLVLNYHDCIVKLNPAEEIELTDAQKLEQLRARQAGAESEIMSNLENN